MNMFFSGIGGIGTSALALIFQSLGFNVKGSDIRESPVTQKLQSLGIKVLIPQTKENITNTKIDLLVKTNALPENHIELVTAKALNIPIFSYPQALGILTNILPSIGIAGTHGKTTTTAIVSKIFLSCNQDIFGLIGAFFKDFNNTNYRVPKNLSKSAKNTIIKTLNTVLQNIYGNNNAHYSNSHITSSYNIKKIQQVAKYNLQTNKANVQQDQEIFFTRDFFVGFKKDYSLPYFIIEADEYKDAFLNHTLDYLVVTSVDFDHADYFKTHKNYLTSFAKAILNTNKVIIANLKDEDFKQVLSIAKQLDTNGKLSSLKFVDWTKFINKAKKSPLYFKTQFLIEDTASALALANTFKFEDSCIYKGISEFTGAWRRFEIINTPINNTNEQIKNSFKNKGQSDTGNVHEPVQNGHNSSLGHKNNVDISAQLSVRTQFVQSGHKDTRGPQKIGKLNNFSKPEKFSGSGLTNTNLQKGIFLINDYAHNPKKLLYAGLALRDFAKQHNLKNAYIYWEPHQYNRTYTLFDEFAEVIFKLLKHDVIKKLIVTDIYGARSSLKDRQKIDAKKFVKKVKALLPKDLANKIYYGGSIENAINQIKMFLNFSNNNAHYWGNSTKQLGSIKKAQHNNVQPQLGKIKTPDVILIASAGKLGEGVYEIV